MTQPLYQLSIHREPKVSLLAAQDRLPKRPKPTPEHPLIISASELRDWLRCRVKHAWRHHLRLVPNAGSENLAIGILVHETLESWYRLPVAKRTGKAMNRLVRARLSQTTPKELTTEHLELVGAMCLGYAEWAIPQDAEIGLRDCTPEQWFELPLTEDKSIIVRGKIDNVFPVHSLKKTMGGNEYKTKARIDVSVVELNLQLSVYHWALRQLYPKAKRYIIYYNVLRKQMPGPRVRAELFVREAVERTDEEIDQWTADTRRAVLDMPGAAIYPNPMDSCQWECDYKGPCLLRGRKADLKDVLRREYHVKENR